MRPIAGHAYAVARLHCIENRMPGREAWERMAEAGSLEEVYKLMSDHGYPQDISYAADIEQVLKDEYMKMMDTIRKMVPEPGYFRIFSLRSDYHNIKVLTKAERTVSDPEPLLEDGGLYAKDIIAEYIRDRKYSAVSDIMRNAIEDTAGAFGRTGDPQVIDILLDKAYFAECMREAAGYGHDFIYGYLAMTIDLVNIKSFIRVRKLDLGTELLSRILIEGGSRDTGTYMELVDEQPEAVLSEFRYSPYGNIVEAGMEGMEKGGTLSVLEKMSDDHTIGYIKPYRHQAFGMEPVLAHIIAREYEAKNIRIIISGIQHGIRPDMILERLRDTYA